MICMLKYKSVIASSFYKLKRTYRISKANKRAAVEQIKRDSQRRQDEIVYQFTIAEGFAGAFLIIFFFSGTIVFFAVAAVAVELGATFALADTLAVYYSLTDKPLATSNTPVETLALGRG